MGKNIVICCDGTNNSMEGPLTNIVRIHELTKGVVGQVSVYDAGVGVAPKPGLKTWVAKKVSKLTGSAFGTGLVRNVEEMYREIHTLYEPGDRLYLFGFS